jgi:hypothetical protein
MERFTIKEGVTTAWTVSLPWRLPPGYARVGLEEGFDTSQILTAPSPTADTQVSRQVWLKLRYGPDVGDPEPL